MPAFQLEATADSAANNAWTIGGGSTKWGNMADANDATDIRCTTAVRQGFVMQDLPSEAVSISGSVTLNHRGKDGTSTGDTTASSFRYSGANYEAGSPPTRDWSTTFSDTGFVWASAPGGVPWSVPILNACEMGVLRAGTTNTIIIARMNVTGTYLPAQGNFAYLIASLIGGMLGANLMMSDMPGISREVALHPRQGEGISIIQPHEYEQALAELKAHPFRAWSL